MTWTSLRTGYRAPATGGLKRLMVAWAVLIVMPAASWAGDEAYFVTQGGGLKPRTGRDWDHSWSVEDFNRGENWSSVDHANRIDPGDTMYFKGPDPITSQLKPAGSGRPGAPITIDGYWHGDCDPLQAECTESVELTGGVWVDWGRDHLIFQDLCGTGGSITWQSFFVAYNHDNNDPSEHLLLRRNYLHDTISSIVGIGDAKDGAKSNDILIENNKLTKFGSKVDTAQGVNISGNTHLVVRNNLIGHHEAVATQCSSANTIEVHYVQHALVEHNEIFGAPTQSDVAVKEHGGQDLIFRFNHFHHNGSEGQGRGLSINWPANGANRYHEDLDDYDATCFF